MELYATKRPNGFQPSGGYNEEQFDKLQNGHIYKLIVRKERSAGYHRKILKMLRCAFEHWEPKARNLPEGVMIERDFEKFRKDLTKAAGFYRVVWNLDGTFETVAKSIAFDNMEQPEFEELANAYVDVILNSSDIVPKDEYQAKNFREEIVSFI